MLIACSRVGKVAWLDLLKDQPSINTDRLRMAGKESVEICHALLQQFDKTNKFCEGVRMQATMSEWQQDISVCSQAIKYGEQYGAAMTEAMIMSPKGAAELLEVSEGSLEEGCKMAIAFFKDSRGHLGNENWGVVMRAQFRALSDMVKTTADHENDL